MTTRYFHRPSKTEIWTSAKVGCTYLKHWALLCDGKTDVYKLSVDDMHDYWHNNKLSFIDEEEKEDLRVSFFRDPFDRFTSAYRNKIATPNKTYYRPGMSIDDFIHTGHANRLVNAGDPHFIAQTVDNHRLVPNDRLNFGTILPLSQMTQFLGDLEQHDDLQNVDNQSGRTCSEAPWPTDKQYETIESFLIRTCLLDFKYWEIASQK